MVEDEEHDSNMEAGLQEQMEADLQDQDENLLPPKRSGRGHNRCLMLLRNSIYEKQPLKFNSKGRVCSLNASMFANWCGCIVRKRTNAPLMVKEWAKIPDEPDYRKKMLEIVGEKFIVPDDENKQKLIMGCLKEKYRNYRPNLKRFYFDKYDTNEERLMHVPPNVAEEDWIYLVNWFSSGEFQVVSARNKRNRAKQVMRHIAGTASFAKREYEEVLKNNGQHPGEYHLFEINYNCNNDQPRDPKSKDIMDNVEERATRVGVGDDDVPVDEDALYVEVRQSEKKRNRVSMIARSMKNEQLRQTREELARSRGEAQELRALAEASMRRADESARQLAEFRENIQRDMAQMRRAMISAGNLHKDSQT